MRQLNHNQLNDGQRVYFRLDPSLDFAEAVITQRGGKLYLDRNIRGEKRKDLIEVTATADIRTP